MANLYANVMQLSRDDDIDSVFQMASAHAAKIMRANYGLALGAVADIVVLDAPNHRSAIQSGAQTLAGWKAGRKTFVRPRPQIFEEMASIPGID
jgi:cytosine deaminase